MESNMVRDEILSSRSRISLSLTMPLGEVQPTAEEILKVLEQEFYCLRDNLADNRESYSRARIRITTTTVREIDFGSKG
jgi:hypothetical protein